MTLVVEDDTLYQYIDINKNYSSMSFMSLYHRYQGHYFDLSALMPNHVPKSILYQCCQPSVKNTDTSVIQWLERPRSIICNFTVKLVKPL